MESQQQKKELIIDYLSDTLTGSDLEQFNKLYKYDVEFALQVDECVSTYAQIAAWHSNKGITGEEDTDKRSKRKFNKYVISSIKYAAAIIAVAFITLFFADQYRSPDTNTVLITETDTVYLPKKEYFSVSGDIIAKTYIADANMDHLVSKASRATRSNDICIPANDGYAHVNNPVSFELSQFKPGKYKIEVVGFLPYTIGVDTLVSTSKSITPDDKIISRWTPKIPGIYYWGIYHGKLKEPILVRRLNVE